VEDLGRLKGGGGREQAGKWIARRDGHGRAPSRCTSRLHALPAEECPFDRTLDTVLSAARLLRRYVADPRDPRLGYYQRLDRLF